MQYRCVASSVTGFVQQLACNLLPHGYWFYVAGRIPPHKDPAAVDAKLMARYGINLSKRERARRKQLGYSNLHYLRYDRRFVIVATPGWHRFLKEESVMLRDIRRVPLKFYGYSIGYRPGGRTRAGEPDPRWHAHVQIERERFLQERAYLRELALRRSENALREEFRQLPFEPYAPVRRQFLQLLKTVNATRKQAGLEPLPTSVLRLRRRIVRPFDPVAPQTAA